MSFRLNYKLKLQLFGIKWHTFFCRSFKTITKNIGCLMKAICLKQIIVSFLFMGRGISLNFLWDNVVLHQRPYNFRTAGHIPSLEQGRCNLKDKVKGIVYEQFCEHYGSNSFGTVLNTGEGGGRYLPYFNFAFESILP